MSFIKHLAPFNDESAFGYIHRLATNNFMDGWKEVARILNVGASRSALMNSIDELSNRLGLPNEWVELIKSNENQCQHWNRFHQSYHIKLCHECIKENPYRKNIWEHVFCTCCVEHQCELIDVCPSCKSDLNKSLIDFAHCKCGLDLSSVDYVRAPVHLLIVSQMMNGYINSKEQGLPFAEKIDANKAANLVRIICQQFDVNLPWLKSTAALPQNLVSAKKFLEPMNEIFNDWPRNLEKHVSLRIQSSSICGYTPTKVLGNWYRGVKDLTLGSSLQFFLEVVLRKSAELCGSTTSFDSASYLLKNDDGYLPISKVVDKYSINRLILIKADKSGRLNFRHIGKANKAFTYEFLEAGVKELKDKRDEWCTAKEAYESLGISQYLFEQMILADLVVVDKQWKSDIYKSGAVSKKSLENFQITIKERTFPSFDDRKIEVKKIASLKLGENSKLHQIFRGIYDGGIKVASTAEKFGDFKISLEDVYRVLKVSEQGKGYSIEELGEITGWKWEAVAYWMDCGLLEFDKYKIKGRDCRFVTPRQLVNFKRKYIPVADLMKNIGRTTTYLKNRLPELPIVGGKSLAGGGFIGGLVPLGDWVSHMLNQKN